MALVATPFDVLPTVLETIRAYNYNAQWQKYGVA
jgi:hypothetical protein